MPLECSTWSTDSPLDEDLIPKKATASYYCLRLPTVPKTDTMSNEAGEGLNGRCLFLDAEQRDSDSSSIASIDSEDIELADELAHSASNLLS